MRRRLGVLAIVLALAAPAAGAAGTPTPRVPPPDVIYVLRGTLSHFVAPHAGANGRLTIDVTDGNRAAAAAVGRTLTLLLTSSTTIVYDAYGRITDGETGIVRIMGGVKPLPPEALQRVPVGSVAELSG